MYRKKFNQLMAAVLAASIVFSQGQTVIAAETDSNPEPGVLTEESAASNSSGETDDLDDPADAASESGDEVEEAAEESSTEDDADASDSASSEDTTENDEDSADAASSDASDEADAAASDDSAALASSEEIVEELPEGLVGMGEGYELNSLEEEVKAEALDNKDMYGDFLGLEEGVNYKKDEVVALSDTEEHAKEIAAAYGGELKSYEYGVAVIDLSDSEVGVAEAFKLAFDEDVELPVVSPNYIYPFEEPAETDIPDTSVVRVVTDENFEIVEDGAEGIPTSSEIFAESDETALDAENASEDEIASEDDEELTGTAAGVWKDSKGKLFNDPFLDPTNSNFQWYHDMIGTFDAWAALGEEGLARTSNVTVAVIDSGVKTDHAELSGHASGDAPTEAHGTHVSGIIAGSRKNNAGGAGIAPGAKILSYHTDCSDASVTAKIKAVTNNGSRKADIINMSLGGPGYDPNLQATIDAAYKAGITIVASMGNDTANKLNYPAGYKHVIAVAAVNETGKRAYFSTYGSWADIAAPGTNIYSSSSNGGYTIMSGTSQAAPIVSGACALYMSKAGHVSPDEMEKALKRTATGSGGSGCGKIVNVAKLVGAAKVPAPKKLKAAPAQSTAPVVGAMTLSASKLDLTYDYMTDGGSAKELAVTSLTQNDKAKTSLLANAAVKVTFESSDARVATVAQSGNKAVITAHRAGTATISVKAQSAAMKSPKVLKCTVKVASPKVVGKIVVTTTKAGQKVDVKSEELYAPAVAPGSFDVVAEQYNTDKKPALIAPKGAPAWTSSNNNVARIETNGAKATIRAVGKGKATITCATKDGSGKKYTFTVNVKKAITDVKVTGQKYVAAGGKATFKATVSADASNKAVTWSLDKDYKDAVKVNPKNGQVTVGSSAAVGTVVKVIATAVDNGKKQGAATFTVKEKTAKIQITAEGSTTLGVVARGQLSNQVKLTASALSASKNSKGQTEYKANGGDLVFTNSNDKVVSMAQSGNTVILTALKNGSAKITAKAQDGSGKSASITVKVVIPVSKVILTTSNGQIDEVVAKGCSVTLKAVVGNTYGTPANKKIVWKREILGVASNGSLTLLPNQAELFKKKAFFTGSGGKVTANKDTTFSQNKNKYASGYSDVVMRVTATAADGSGASATKIITPVKKPTVFGYQARNQFGLYVGVKRNVRGPSLPAGDIYALPLQNNGSVRLVKVTSSNPKVASAFADSSTGEIVVIGYKKGSASIKATTIDGSNISATVSVRFTGNETYSAGSGKKSSEDAIEVNSFTAN